MKNNSYHNHVCCDAKLFVEFEYYLKMWLKSRGHDFSKHKPFGALIKKIKTDAHFESYFYINNYQLEEIHRTRNAYMHSLGTKKSKLSPGNRDKVSLFIKWCQENLIDK